MSECGAMAQLRARARPRAAGRGRARERLRATPASIAAWSGLGSGPLESRIAPRRRLRVGVTEPVAGSKSPSWRVSIRSAKRSSTAASSIAAAERMRAPEAWPATSPTASHWLPASDEAGSSRKPRPPTDCQVSPDASRRRRHAVGEGERQRSAELVLVDLRFADVQAAPPACGELARSFGAAATCPSASGASEAPGRGRCRRGRARSAARRRRRRPRRSRDHARRAACARGAAPAAARRSPGREP